MKNNSKFLNIIGNTHRGIYTNTENFGDERFVGINLEGNHGDLRVEFVYITNNHISMCSGHGIGYTANYVKIVNNDFHYIAWHGIYHYGGLCASICNNTFKEVGKLENRYAIITGNNPDERSEAVTINGNSVANLRGIKIDTNSHKIIVTGNVSPVLSIIGDECIDTNNFSR